MILAWASPFNSCAAELFVSIFLFSTLRFFKTWTARAGNEPWTLTWHVLQLGLTTLPVILPVTTS